MPSPGSTEPPDGNRSGRFGSRFGNPQTGDWLLRHRDADFMLVIVTKDMERYELFTRRCFYENPNIKNFKAMVVMDRVKVGFVLPLELEAK